MRKRSRRRAWPLAAAALVVAAVAAVATLARADGPHRAPTASDPGPAAAAHPAPASATGGPLAGRGLYVDPGSDAAVQVREWIAQGRTADARALVAIAGRPAAIWVTAGPGPVRERVDAVVSRAAAAGQVPVLVAYNIPHRDCGSFSAGGAASAAEYRAWIRGFAAGIGNRTAVVIVEPDAVPHMVDGCADGVAQRYALLRDAVAVLKATGSALVYLDAGNPGWITDTTRLAAALREAGVGQADGFALNVANFVTTADNITFGDRVAAELGGRAHFVIDTSRNGAGPVHGASIDGGPRWCNPPGRALGPAPTTSTGRPRLDALLWIKNPGESDGACRPGEPPAGKWWPQYALDLVRRPAPSGPPTERRPG
ncbi:glycoside hydrolase family 6 protein [Actinoplanes sp. CA-030573]|uniref:glycoside hydrolase family 6 protein n=1 Tax=Actinoplanes sp. CA-030573 TaxID=3239898 RepID=UPI003D8D6B4D